MTVIYSKNHALLIVLFITIANKSFGVKLEDQYEWKYIDYVWNNLQRQEVIKSDNYDPIKNILFDDEASGILIKKITITL